ncbi:MAG: outer membrane protein assembly factor BamD [Edaphocola sp.]
MRKFCSSLLVFSLLFALGSCKSAFEKVLASNDIDYKFEKANELYEQNKYMKANELYENLIPSFRGKKSYEELFYRYCYSFFYQEDYLSASYQFKNFVEYFPKSSKADECEYMYAKCLYLQSPKFSLDQTNTIKAMEVLQTYINTHPGSANLKEANDYIDQCRAKIEKKDANTALLYFNIGEYKSASAAYKALIQEYPESARLDFYQLMLMRSCFKYAERSIPEKREERYAETVNGYKDFQQYTPNSPLKKDAEKLSASAQSIINQLRNEHK